MRLLLLCTVVTWIAVEGHLTNLSQPEIPSGNEDVAVQASTKEILDHLDKKREHITATDNGNGKHRETETDKYNNYRIESTLTGKPKTDLFNRQNVHSSSRKAQPGGIRIRVHDVKPELAIAKELQRNENSDHIESNPTTAPIDKITIPDDDSTVLLSLKKTKVYDVRNLSQVGIDNIHIFKDLYHNIGNQLPSNNDNEKKRGEQIGQISRDDFVNLTTGSENSSNGRFKLDVNEMTFEDHSHNKGSAAVFDIKELGQQKVINPFPIASHTIKEFASNSVINHSLKNQTDEDLLGITYDNKAKSKVSVDKDIFNIHENKTQQKIKSEMNSRYPINESVNLPKIMKTDYSKPIINLEKKAYNKTVATDQSTGVDSVRTPKLNNIIGGTELTISDLNSSNDDQKLDPSNAMLDLTDSNTGTPNFYSSGQIQLHENPIKSFYDFITASNNDFSLFFETPASITAPNYIPNTFIADSYDDEKATLSAKDISDKIFNPDSKMLKDADELTQRFNERTVKNADYTATSISP